MTIEVDIDEAELHAAASRWLEAVDAARDVPATAPDDHPEIARRIEAGLALTGLLALLPRSAAVLVGDRVATRDGNGRLLARDVIRPRPGTQR